MYYDKILKKCGKTSTKRLSLSTKVMVITIHKGNGYLFPQKVYSMLFTVVFLY